MDTDSESKLFELLALRDALTCSIDPPFASGLGNGRAYMILSQLRSRRSMTTAQLARAARIPETSVRRAIDKFVERGLVLRTSPMKIVEDQRWTHVSITTEGLHALSEAVDTRDELVETLNRCSLPRGGDFWGALKELREEIDASEQRRKKKRL